MTIRVLVVDDSSFIRNRIAEILTQETGIEVVGYAANGVEAVRKTTELHPDVITMDVEMPVMDGISATKQIMRDCPTPILMFSVSTQAGAKATLDALEAGAMDFLPKHLNEINGDLDVAKHLLRIRVLGLGGQSPRLRQQQPITPVSLLRYSRANLRDLRLVVIAASTGGPVALQQILLGIPATFSVPILLVQHMPGNFTKSFAERLNQICNIRVKEAENGDELKPGVAYLAPGGFQMELAEGARKTLTVRESRPGETYRPCADITFSSVAKNFSGKVLAMVLTGMGADGKLGVEKLKAAGGCVWAQNEASCTVYGMPKAIVDAHLADTVFDLNEMALELKSL